MKKLTAVLLALIMTLALAACSGSKDEETTSRLTLADKQEIGNLNILK